MMFYLNSKTFANLFLENETYENILNGQYILVSTKIKARDKEVGNVLVANSTLMPESSVYLKLTKDDARDDYFNQLEENALPLLASLVKLSVEKNLNIIFVCTKKEDKLKYLRMLSEFIYCTFDYPVYDYIAYSSGCGLLKYNKKKVIKTCNNVLNVASEEQYQRDKKTDRGRVRIKQNIKKLSKKKMKEKLEDKNLYIEGMSKSEMREMLELFM